MASVDDRIVRMEFDNASFEKKISTTLASLGQLEKALKFTGGTKGLTDVSAAANKLDMSTISNGIENVSKRFLALGTIALTVLSNITTQALQAGTQLVKAFTIQPVLDGFREYETNMQSIQTILANTASKGTTLEQVNDALDRLNKYSDQTIYNFAQMARNIGTFTAAGVDLETSVNSIKGIANLAAMSGSTSEQASTAMYQLSQAIAAGKMTLMDWNSVVNAGMGGEAFKSSLFETAKAMGNVLNVPMDMTFQQWEDAGNSFRESLQEGWITADILTTALSTFTGDMTEEMLIAKGFTQDQATQILKTAQIAKAAATEVKTFSQLMSTLKEAVSTGWADSFKLIIGNFTEAKELWTSVSNAVGGFITRTADARNAVLQGWKDFGSRAELIDAFKIAFTQLSFIITAVKNAFSDIFPPITASTLIVLTHQFKQFMLSLTPTAETLDKIHRIAQGFFAALSIGWEIIKEGTKFIIGLAKSLLSLFTPEATSFLAKLGDGLSNLQAALVKGGGIKDFFAGLTAILQKPIELLEKIKNAIGNMFDFWDDAAAGAVGSSIDRVGNRFQFLKDIFSSAGKLWEPFEKVVTKILDILGKLMDGIGEIFQGIKDKFSNAFKESDFEGILDAINTGLLGGIALLIAKFLKKGFNISTNIDLGGGLLQKIGGTFQELTKTLSAMQTQIKANALLKIAAAIAILTASVVVLASIDSAALTKALTAMAAGFAELMASFTILSKLASTPGKAASFSMLAAGLIALSVAILILSTAVKILATLSWDELARGLTAVVALLGALTVASKFLSANAGGMIRAGIAITGIAAGMVILAIAMKIFATMSWEEMAKGLIGVAGGLVIIAGALKLMPNGAKMALQGAGIMVVATGLLVLASAVAIFGNMEWITLGKGLGAVAAGLIIIAIAMRLMPVTMPIIAAGLVLVGFALIEIAGAMQIFSSMSWEEIAKGVAAMAGSLIILAVATRAMQGNLLGAASLIVMAIGLGLLAKVLKEFSGISWEDLLNGLGKLAITLGVLALAAMALQSALPAMMGLGIALALLGAGFALIGVGAMFVAKALEMIAASGAKAAEVLPEILKAIGEAIPAWGTGLAKGLVNMALVFTKSAPIFAESIGQLILALLIELQKIIPQLGPVMILAINEMIRVIRATAPQLIATGFFLLITFLKGIRDNIGQIVTLVGDIIVNFLNAFAGQIPRIGESLATTIVTAFLNAAYNIGLIAPQILIGVGVQFIQGLWDGLMIALGPVGQWLMEIPGKVIGFIGDVLNTLWQTGANLINGLWNGIKDIWNSVTGWLGSFLDNIWSLISNPLDKLYHVGVDIMNGLWNGLKAVWNKIKGWIEGAADFIKSNFTDKLGLTSPSKVMHEVGLNIMRGLHYGMQEEWKELEAWMDGLDPSKNIGDSMSNALSMAAAQISNMEDFNPTITPVLDLTQIAADASRIGDLIQTSDKLVPSYSLNQARVIARQQNAPTDTSSTETTLPQGINFEQNIYSPTQLSTSDIYKQTRNQITIAKEELSIP